MTPEVIYGILGGVGGLLTIITTFLLKLHCSRSTCNGGSLCCGVDLVFDKEEKETLKRHRTEKRKSLDKIIIEQPRKNKKNNDETIYNTLDRTKILQV